MTNHLPELPKAYVDAQLQLLRGELEQGTYPGYPPETERLVTCVKMLGRTATGELILPDGNWFLPSRFATHSDGLKPSELVSEALQRAGYELDSEGRPLHPWFRTMIEDPALGVLCGKGFFWSWGPNRTADSVVVHDGSILLVQRKDTGTWALPGGFIDGGEHAAHAARREVREETGIDLDSAWGIPFYKGPVVGRRMTAHAWPETTAFLFSVDERQQPRGGDDAAQAAWVPLEELNNMQLFGSHTFLARLALSQLTAAHE